VFFRLVVEEEEGPVSFVDAPVDVAPKLLAHGAYIERHQPRKWKKSKGTISFL
jgi:hypothetical protein